MENATASLEELDGDLQQLAGALGLLSQQATSGCTHAVQAMGTAAVMSHCCMKHCHMQHSRPASSVPPAQRLHPQPPPPPSDASRVLAGLGLSQETITSLRSVPAALRDMVKGLQADVASGIGLLRDGANQVGCGDFTWRPTPAPPLVLSSCSSCLHGSKCGGGQHRARPAACLPASPPCRPPIAHPPFLGFCLVQTLTDLRTKLYHPTMSVEQRWRFIPIAGGRCHQHATGACVHRSFSGLPLLEQRSLLQSACGASVRLRACRLLCCSSHPAAHCTCLPLSPAVVFGLTMLLALLAGALVALMRWPTWAALSSMLLWAAILALMVLGVGGLAAQHPRGLLCEVMLCAPASAHACIAGHVHVGFCRHLAAVFVGQRSARQQAARRLGLTRATSPPATNWPPAALMRGVYAAGQDGCLYLEAFTVRYADAHISSAEDRGRVVAALQYYYSWRDIPDDQVCVVCCGWVGLGWIGVVWCGVTWFGVVGGVSGGRLGGLHACKRSSEWGESLLGADVQVWDGWPDGWVGEAVGCLHACRW